MKKVFLIGYLLLHFTANAQKNKIAIGVQGGVNLNNIYKRIADQSTDNITGLSLGGNVRFGLSNHFGLRTQLSYDQFGWAYRGLVLESGVFTGALTDFVSKISYINIPMLAEYSFGKKIKLNVNAGPYAGILLNYKIIETTQPLILSSRVPENRYNSQYGRKFNFGVTAGLGIQIPLTPKIEISLDVRNYTGLTGVQKNNSSPKIATFSFLTGLSYRL